MRTMVIAVTLLAMALVPAFADGPSKDLEVEINVAEQTEIYHGENLQKISLTVRDAMAWFGESIPMNMLANVDCKIYVSVDDAANEIPEFVELYIVTNENGLWNTHAKEIDGSSNRRFDERYDWDGGQAPGWSLTAFQTSGDPNSKQLTVSRGGSIPSTLVYELEGDRQPHSTNNIYAVYAGNGMAAPTEEPGIVKVVYTITAP